MTVRKIKRLLIANRGEIACRIMRSCRSMGIEAVAVYSDPDSRSLHTRMADLTVALGGAETRESYLNMEKVLAAAKSAQCDAIHPGYGFLSENADFAARVLAAGMYFIGPSPEAIRALGDKLSSKRIARAAAVPLLPSVEDIDWEKDAAGCRPRIEAFVKQFGFPLLIKASAGGGGRGMKKVLRAEDLDEALGSASREAQSFFGNSMLFIERYVERARHVEVQIVGDRHGNVLHLFDRDCSCQRNHQKVIEEAPAPALKDETRAMLYDAACRLAKAAGYSNAGTVEFLVDHNQQIYFLEVNSRLQVEHPVTEAITGVDLVALQIEVAEGRDLLKSPPPIPERPIGCAIEVRICAEQPEHGFIAATGRLNAVTWPEGEQVRIDTGFTPGDRVTHYYDSLLAKLIISGASRQESLQRLYDAFECTAISGIATNLAFIQRLVKQPAFIDVQHHIQWAQQFASGPEQGNYLAAIAAGLLAARPLPQHAGPWDRRNAFRICGAARQLHRVKVNDDVLDVSLESHDGASFMLSSSGQSTTFRLLEESSHEPFRSLRLLSDHPYFCQVLSTGESSDVIVNGQRYLLHVDVGVAHAVDDNSHTNFQVKSPLPGKVVAVKVQPAQMVEEGQILAILESMKMEHPIVAPRQASVATVHVSAGSVVEAKSPLFSMVTVQ